MNYAVGRPPATTRLKDGLAGQPRRLPHRSRCSFFETITAGALPADAVAKELKTHIETLAGAIDSLKKALLPA